MTALKILGCWWGNKVFLEPLQDMYWLNWSLVETLFRKCFKLKDELFQLCQDLRDETKSIREKQRETARAKATLSLP